MNISDILKLADDKLAEVFHTKPHDPTKARSPIIKGLDRTKNQHASATPVKGKKWFKVSNGVVEFTPPFAIGGKTTHYIPTERFTDFIDGLKEAVGLGHLDKDIEAGSTKTPATKTARAPRATNPSAGNGWSEERKAKFAATIAARKAAAGEE